MNKKNPYNAEEINLFMSISKEIQSMADQKLLNEKKQAHHGRHHKDHNNQKKTILKRCEEHYFELFENEVEKIHAKCERFYTQLKGDNPNLYQKIKEKAEEFSKKQDTLKSIHSLSQANQSLFSENVLREVYEKGVSWFQDEHFEIASLYFMFLSFVDSKNPQVWLMKGMSEQNSEHYDEALSSYAVSISLDSSVLAVYIQIINCLILAQHLDRAREIYDLLMHEIDPHEYVHNEYMLSKIEEIREYLYQTVQG